MRPLHIFLFIVFAGPVALGFGMNALTGMMMYNTTKNINASFAPTPAYETKLDIRNHLNSRQQARDGYLSMLAPDKMSDLRKISIDSVVPVTAFLKPGEALPEKAFLDVFINARAASIAARECALLNAHLTTKCELTAASADLSDDGRSVALRARYDYVQRPDFGSFDRRQPLWYDEIDQDITQAVDGSPETARDRVYRHVAALCDKLRKAQGNCGLAELRLRTHSRDASTLLGRASFGTIQPRA